MTNPPVLLSVNTGLPKNVAWQGKTVYTGVWKHPVDGPTMVRRLNIDGDGQGDLAGHGGEQRAVLVYQVQSYRHWQQHFGRDDLGYGQFGENLTVDGLTDDEVCIGDRYRIGEAEFEVTQPRVTCYRVGLRLGPGLTEQAGRPPHQPPGPPGAGPMVTFGAQRPVRALPRRPAQRARAGRRLRRPHPVELQVRRLPHLQHTPAVRDRQLRPGPAGTSGRRGGAHLLRPAQRGRRARHVKARAAASPRGFPG